MQAEEIFLKCDSHGTLTRERVNKAGLDKHGRQKYKCKECLKLFHHVHYLNNKDKIKLRQSAYKEANREKVLEIKRVSNRNKWAERKERYRGKRREWVKNNEDKVSEKNKRYKKKARENISDCYVKGQIIQRTDLKHVDLPQEIIELYRAQIKLKRLIKEVKQDGQD